jgi:lipopolysaccharide biosynthesis regulator YciM
LCFIQAGSILQEGAGAIVKYIVLGNIKKGESKMAGDFSAPLTLSTACEGKLEDEFQKMYPELVESLRGKGKASITITLQMQRVPDTQTMVRMDYKIKPTFPPVERSSVCRIDKKHKLKTDAPPKTMQTLMSFDGGKGNE